MILVHKAGSQKVVMLERPHGLDEAVPCLGGLFATFYNRGLRASLPLVSGWLSLVLSYQWLIGALSRQGASTPHACTGQQSLYRGLFRSQLV